MLSINYNEFPSTYTQQKCKKIVYKFINIDFICKKIKEKFNNIPIFISNKTIEYLKEFFLSIDIYNLLRFNRKYNNSIESHNLCLTKNNIDAKIYLSYVIELFCDEIKENIIATINLKNNNCKKMFELTEKIINDFGKSKTKWIYLFSKGLDTCITMEIMHYYIKNEYCILQQYYLKKPDIKFPTHYTKITDEIIDEIFDLVLLKMKSYDYFVNKFLNTSCKETKDYIEQINYIFCKKMRPEYLKDEISDKELLNWCFYVYFTLIFLVYYLQIKYVNDFLQNDKRTIEEILIMDKTFSLYLLGYNDGKKIYNEHLQKKILFVNMLCLDDV